MSSRIELIQGDITRLQVDAIVNAANRSLMGGGGVDGAIHRAAGSRLLDACRLLGGCETGQAKITPGFNLPARFVIHTVGPVWQGGDRNESALLAACYHNTLKLATAQAIHSLAFPNISTGIYGFPRKPAAEIAVHTVKQYLKQSKIPEKVYFICFDEENFTLYQGLMDREK